MAKNDSAIALSQQIPVWPIDLVMPFSAANLLNFAAAYDGDGSLVKQTMPGNVVQRTVYDDAGEPVVQSYSGQVTPVTSSTDADGNTVYIPGTPEQDKPWLVWHPGTTYEGGAA